MTIIVYGKNKDFFETDVSYVPNAIIELYKHCGGRMGQELFERIIKGLTHEGTTEDMVEIFDHSCCDMPIHKIYTYAETYFSTEET